MGYDLLIPRVGCTDITKENEWAYEDLRSALLKKIDGWQNAKTIDHVSIYFRELDNGPRFGIGEYENFYPSSLLKLPVLIALLHAADQQPDLLQETISTPSKFPTLVNVEKPSETIKPNTTYTIEELLEKMIVFSDNNSANLLVGKLNTMPALTVQNTFLDLGIKDMMEGDEPYVSIQLYGRIFPVLYNASYLSKKMSQLALSLLTQTTFENGLVMGVPKGTRVAHKFGYRQIAANMQQLHDCGIVYHPEKPYVLCVMTSGTDAKKDGEAISEISRLTYEYVSGLYADRSTE